MTIMWKTNGFFNPFNLCQCVLKPLFFYSSVERALKSCSASTVALTGLNKSAARFHSERVSKIIPDSRLCWERAAALLDADIKGKSAFVTLPSLVCCEGVSAAFHNRNSAHRVVLLPRNSAASPAFFARPSKPT